MSENMELSEKNEKKAETPSLEPSPDKRDEPVKVQIVCPTMVNNIHIKSIELNITEKVTMALVLI